MVERDLDGGPSRRWIPTDANDNPGKAAEPPLPEGRSPFAFASTVLGSDSLIPTTPTPREVSRLPTGGPRAASTTGLSKIPRKW